MFSHVSYRFKNSVMLQTTTLRLPPGRTETVKEEVAGKCFNNTATLNVGLSFWLNFVSLEFFTDDADDTLYVRLMSWISRS